MGKPTQVGVPGNQHKCMQVGKDSHKVSDTSRKHLRINYPIHIRARRPTSGKVYNSKRTTAHFDWKNQRTGSGTSGEVILTCYFVLRKIAASDDSG